MVGSGGGRSWDISLLKGSLGGAAYATTATLLSHPFDTIKTRQQVGGAATLTRLYHGFTPALAGSIAFRTVPFIAYNATTNHVRPRSEWLASHPVALAALGGFMGGAARSLLECPCEYVKTRRQIGRQWSVRKAYTGLSVTLARNSAVIALF